MTGQSTDTTPPIINLQTTSARLGISIGSPIITLDGEKIGTLEREIRDNAKGVFVARMPDVKGHRAYAENGSFSELAKRVAIVVTGILRKSTPDADWGPLPLEASPGEFADIKAGTRTVLRFPFAYRYGRVACPHGREVIIRNGTARGRDNRLRGSIVAVNKVSAAVAHAADALLDMRYPRAKTFAVITFELAVPDAP